MSGPSGNNVAVPTASRQPGLAAAIFDLSRGRQALLSVAQPALGALLAIGVLPSSRIIALGLVAATTGFLAVFSLNDVLDRRVDEDAVRLARAEASDTRVFDIDIAFERHPVAQGALSPNIAIAWVALLGVTSAVAAYFLNPLCLALFAAAVGLEVLYCSLRARTWMKTFVSGAMVGVGGLAGWVAVAPLSVGAGVFFAFLALWEIAGRNLPNDLSDLEDDSRVGLTTVSTVFGPRTAAKAILVGSALTAVSVLLLPATPLVILVAFAIVALLMVVPAVRLNVNASSADAAHPDAAHAEAAAYFNRASLVPAVIFVAVFAAAILGWL